MIKVIIQYNGITLHFWEKFCLCASLKLMPSSKTKRPLKSHEWQILKRVFNIYEPLYLPRLNKDHHSTEIGIQSGGLCSFRATVVTKMAHSYSEA